MNSEATHSTVYQGLKLVADARLSLGVAEGDGFGAVLLALVAIVIFGKRRIHTSTFRQLLSLIKRQ